LEFDTYMARQSQHRAAEISALLDCPQFSARAHDLYGYEHFVCDTSGSICEVVDPFNPADPVLSALSDHVLPVWIEGSEAHTAELIRRFDRAPKPMYYQPAFLAEAWASYQAETGHAAETIDPDAFVRWTFARALSHRAPRYRAMAKNWGIRVCAQDVGQVRSQCDFDDLIAQALT
jgi:hypothetical protein